MNKRSWLIGYNAVTLLAWMGFIAVFLLDGLELTYRGATVLAVAQGLAVFEVAHAVLGIAGSNWLLTTLQVASRFMLTAILFLMASSCPCEGMMVYGYPLIAVAWGATEVVRALNYLADLWQRKWQTVKRLRYSLFIALYPIGVTGEFLILYGYWQWRGGQMDAVAIVLAAVAVSYAVFFPKLYGHMLGQRKKKLTTA